MMYELEEDHGEPKDDAGHANWSHPVYMHTGTCSCKDG